MEWPDRCRIRTGRTGRTARSAISPRSRPIRTPTVFRRTPEPRAKQSDDNCSSTTRPTDADTSVPQTLHSDLRQPAVDGHLDAVDVARSFTGEKAHHRGDTLRLTELIRRRRLRGPAPPPEAPSPIPGPTASLPAQRLKEGLCHAEARRTRRCSARGGLTLHHGAKNRATTTANAPPLRPPRLRANNPSLRHLVMPPRAKLLGCRLP